MTQFIQYLYEYENGKRIRNLGFMKVEKQMDKSIIQIYSKQIDEVKGIQFQREDGSKYYAAWEAEMEEAAKQEEAEMQEVPKEEKTERQGAVEIEPTKTEPTKTEATKTEPMKIEEEIADYTPPSTSRFEKIQRQDLSRLPRKEWRLANNSFLLHGYYNYHHLLYIEDNGQVWIGVPGIFHEKEKMAANAFGFSEFRRLTDMELELSEEEKNTYEDFGYWCRQIDRQQMGEQMMNQDEKFMKEAIKQARKAYALEEVPIGCVIVYEGKIIARGYNRRTIDKNVIAHAEMMAIRKACRKLGDWRLEDCTMYVTLEPCQMCAGAIVQSRMKKVVVGCMNPKAGCAGSVLNLLQIEAFNHQVELEIGVLEEECSSLMKNFFKELREKKR